MSTSGDTTTTIEAAAAAAGLRQLADLVIEHPDLICLFDFSELSVVARDADEFHQLADLLGAGPDHIRYPHTQEWTDRRRNFGPVVTAVSIATEKLATETKAA